MEQGSLLASGAIQAWGGCPRPLCRNFVRGTCRWGQSCRFLHDRKSAQVCRFFQRGFCSYGERCSYQHIPEQPVPVGTHYDPMPPIPPVPPGRWGSQPASVPAAVARGEGGPWRSSVHPVPTVTHVAFKFPSVEVEEEEKNKESIPAPGNVPRGAVSREFVPARARGASGSRPRGLGPNPNSDPREVMVAEMATVPAEVPTAPGAAAAPVPPEVLRARSEAMVCGICMDRVYEKALPEERLFGILPNCSHAYCLGCIRKWRRSRDFHSMVIKACPECRVTSSYYIPHKYWVSDTREKEELIESFKARMGKIRCKFFVQNHGHCPFESDCIYLHELPAGRLPRHQQRQRRMPVELSLSPSESSDEEDEELWAVSLDADVRYWSYSLAMLFLDFINSD